VRAILAPRKGTFEATAYGEHCFKRFIELLPIFIECLRVELTVLVRLTQRKKTRS
jgi:hypothetical protein